MEQIWSRLIKTAAAVGGAIAGMFGGWDALMRVLVTMMAVDYVSGLIVAAMGRSNKTEYGGLSSKVGFVGLAKKALMMMVVLMATMLDGALNLGTAVCRDAACWFYVANEGLSIIENLNLIGVPFPAKIKELLGEKAAEDNEPPDVEQ